MKRQLKIFGKSVPLWLVATLAITIVVAAAFGSWLATARGVGTAAEGVLLTDFNFAFSEGEGMCMRNLVGGITPDGLCTLDEDHGVTATFANVDDVSALDVFYFFNNDSTTKTLCLEPILEAPEYATITPVGIWPGYPNLPISGAAQIIFTIEFNELLQPGQAIDVPLEIRVEDCTP